MCVSEISSHVPCADRTDREERVREAGRRSSEEAVQTTQWLGLLSWPQGRRGADTCNKHSVATS